jgi:hypothetical protein
MTYSEEQWDTILNDTWGHNPYYDLMCSILYQRHPVEVEEDHSDLWWETKTFTADELRDEIERIETYWKDKLLMLQHVITELREELK